MRPTTTDANSAENSSAGEMGCVVATLALFLGIIWLFATFPIIRDLFTIAVTMLIAVAVWINRHRLDRCGEWNGWA